MEGIPLGGGWQADLGSGFIDVPVPGCWEELAGSKRLAGPVIYRREFLGPPIPKGKRLLLSFDAVSYACGLSVNGRPVGSHEGMWDRFSFDVTDFVRPDERNEIRLTVEKPGYSPTDRFPLREVLSGFIPDVLCTFGGIWGDVTLRETVGPTPEGLSTQVDLARKTAELRIQLLSLGAASVSGKLVLRLSSEGRTVFTAQRDIVVDPGSTIVTERIPLEGLTLWSPEEPALYHAEALVRTADGETQLRSRVGLREIRVEGERILLNGEPIYLRGALHWGYYPDRIIPRPSQDEMRGELERLRELGFNAVKFCLWVPRDEYYELCDELGMLAWLELPLWLPRVSPALEARMCREYPRIVSQVAHHPSLIAYSLGCELGKDVRGPVLEALAREVRELSGGALLRDNSGSGECYGGLAEDFSDFSDYHFYADPQNLEPLIETFTPRWRAVRPWLFGEYADADTWRIVRTGRDAPWWSLKDQDANPVSFLKPDFRLHLQGERLSAPGFRGRSGELAAASREHALLHRKLTIESTRAFPEVGGYNVTAIRDVPIATSGIFDDSMEPKFEPDDFLPFNSDLVLVPRWDLARAWICGDRVLEADRYSQSAGADFALRIVASNYRTTIKEGSWGWSIVDSSSQLIAQGTGALGASLSKGATRELFRISARLPETSVPVRLTIAAWLDHAAGRVENRWPLFLWPRPSSDRLRGRIALHDPFGILEPLRDVYGAVDFDTWPAGRTGGGSRAGSDARSGAKKAGASGAEGARADSPIVAASQLDERVERFVLEGGKALLVQRGRGPFAHSRVAFWREGFALFEDHPLCAGFLPGLFRELALYGMATDTALSWIEPDEVVLDARPVITRVDAREFLAQHYLVELDYGGGTLIVTTLRIEGGMGKQPSGLAANSAALYLVDRILQRLAGV